MWTTLEDAPTIQRRGCLSQNMFDFGLLAGTRGASGALALPLRLGMAVSLVVPDLPAAVSWTLDEPSPLELPRRLPADLLLAFKYAGKNVLGTIVRDTSAPQGIRGCLDALRAPRSSLTRFWMRLIRGFIINILPILPLWESKEAAYSLTPFQGILFRSMMLRVFMMRHAPDGCRSLFLMEAMLYVQAFPGEMTPSRRGNLRHASAMERT